jgi:hypothetical protein
LHLRGGVSHTTIDFNPALLILSDGYRPVILVARADEAVNYQFQGLNQSDAECMM